MAGYLIFGASLVALYTASALYHGVRREAPWLQRFDHMAIYLLIAGSYAPMALTALRGPWGDGLLAAQGLLAAIGIGANLGLGGGPKWLRLVLYLVMGWMALAAIGPMRATFPPGALDWLLAGGIAYTVGCVVYAVKRPRLWPAVFGSHELWHLFVLAGSACHFVVAARMALVP